MSMKPIETGVESKRPVLFLDIDGVMNSTGSILQHKSNRIFTPEAIRCLRQIIAKTTCSIVISSSWREPEQWLIVPEVFTRNGLGQVLDLIIGTTPIFPSSIGATREDEVDYWLAAHRHSGPYAILDDIPCSGDHSTHWVQTSTETGLTGLECERTIKLLGRPPIDC